jgi:hypothetical protein
VEKRRHQDSSGPGGAEDRSRGQAERSPWKRGAIRTRPAPEGPKIVATGKRSAARGKETFFYTIPPRRGGGGVYSRFHPPCTTMVEVKSVIDPKMLITMSDDAKTTRRGFQPLSRDDTPTTES